MKAYQEITIIKSPDISPYFIWSKLYTQLHLAMVEQKNSDQTVSFGVSFPEYKYVNEDNKTVSTLGNKLRVFARDEAALQQLDLIKWLERFADYLHIKRVQSVPETITAYLFVKKYCADLNLERLTRRFMRRKSKRTGIEISFEQAKAIQNKRFSEKYSVSLEEAELHYLQPKLQNFPFIKLRSLSNNKEFSLQIEQIVTDKPHVGTFNTYGLSSQSSVPHW